MSVLLPGEVLWPQKDQVFRLSQVSVLFVSFFVLFCFSFFFVLFFIFCQYSFALLGSAGGEFMKAFDSMRSRFARAERESERRKTARCVVINLQ